MTGQSTDGFAGPGTTMGSAEWFRRRASRNPERPALSFDGDTWSYRDMQDRIEKYSAVLAACGVQRTTRIGYLGFNHPGLLVTLFAAAHLGAIFVPLNFRLSSRELKQCIDDVDIQTLIVDRHHQPLIEEVRPALGCKHFICTEQSALSGWASLDDLIRAAPPAPPPVDGAPDDVAVLIFTSGTTGRAKAAMLTTGNLWANNTNWILASDFTSRDVAINIAPCFHVGGLCVVALPIWLVGGHVVLQQSFDALNFMRAIETYRVTVTSTVPAVLLAMSQHEIFADVDLSSLRLIVIGGQPIPEPMLKLYNERGIPVSQCYGMTESTSAVTFLDTDRAMSKLGSCGRAGILNDVRLIDFSGREITEPHVHGEICMRGGNVIRGYWNLPEASAEAFDSEGWFRSGDIGYFDQDGFYYVCDRVKDMIISGGENIYPAEIESSLYEHPAIAELAVIGVADERWGERVVAIAALKPGTRLTLEDLQTFAGGRLARYKMPRELHIVDALPRNGNGKIIKPALRQQFAKSRSG